MKSIVRIFLVFFVTLFAVLGCSKDSLTMPNSDLENYVLSDEAIGFSMAPGWSLEKETKGSVTTIGQFNSFGVFSFYRAPGETTRVPSMNNQLVEKNGTNWTYSPIKYWPAGGTLAFYAYSPYSADVELNNTSGNTYPPSIDYTVNSDVTLQEDLLVASLDPMSGGEVKFDFKHALSKVSFSIVGGGNSVVQSITIKGINSKGVYNLEEESWSDQSVPIDFTAKLNEDLENVPVSGSSAHNITNSTGYLFMIPQMIPIGTEIVVKYKDSASNNQETTIRLDSPMLWLSGKSYDCQLSFDISDAKVEFVSEPVFYDAHYVRHSIIIKSDVSDWRAEISGSGVTNDESGWAYISRELSYNNDGAEDNDYEITENQLGGLWSWVPNKNVTSLTGNKSGQQTLYLFLRENLTDAERTATIKLSSGEAGVVPKTFNITQLPVKWIEGEDYGIERIEEEPEKTNYGQQSESSITYKLNMSKVDPDITNTYEEMSGWNGFQRGIFFFTNLGACVRAIIINSQVGGTMLNDFGPLSSVELTYGVDVSGMLSTSDGLSNTKALKNSAVGVNDLLNQYYDASGDLTQQYTIASAVIYKNADLNNSGGIDDDEVVWYLPSKEQLDSFADQPDAYPGQPFSATYYWSSTAIENDPDAETDLARYRSYARNFDVSGSTSVSRPRSKNFRYRAIRVKP